MIRILMPLLLIVLLAGCREILYTDLSQAQANEMLEVLVSEKVDASKRRLDSNQYSIEVEADQLVRAIQVLKEYGLPREQFKSMGEIFAKDGLVSSPFSERIRYVYGLTQSIQDTLMQIDGVLTARVQIVLPENNPYAEAIKPSSAAVFIKHPPQVDLSTIKQKVKMIVEKSIQGLSYTKISVVMMPARSLRERQRVEEPTAPVAEQPTLYPLAYLGLFGILGAGMYLLRAFTRREPAPQPAPEAKPEQRGRVVRPVSASPRQRPNNASTSE